MSDATNNTYEETNLPLEMRNNIGIAIDGGGIKGIMVAEGLKELERQLKVDRLADCPQLKVVAGTSTGAVIAAAIALGFSAKEIVELYERLGAKVFSRMGAVRPFGLRLGKVSPILLPLIWILGLVGLIGRGVVWVIWSARNRDLGFLNTAIDVFLYLMLPARYSIAPLEELLREQIKKKLDGTGYDDTITLEDLGNFLEQRGSELTLIITASDPVARQTQFFKSHSTNDIRNEPDQESRRRKQIRAQNQFAHVIMASSTIPTYWDPMPLCVPVSENNEVTRGFVDGGVGSFGNPAAVVAWEFSGQYKSPGSGKAAAKKVLGISHDYDPATVTIYSFGTGHIDDNIYKKEHNTPDKWWALSWTRRLVDVFSGDATREHSQNIIYQHLGIDLRRFQISFKQEISADDIRRNTLETLKKFGFGQLAELIASNKHALQKDKSKRHDPENIWDEDLRSFLP